MNKTRTQKLVVAARLAALLALLIFSTNGCAGISPARMVPKPGPESQSNSGRSLTGQSLRIVKVTGGQESSFGGPEYVHADQFQQALILALRQSRLFSAVNTDYGDLDLYASIRTQNQRISRGLQYTATMVVSYRIENPEGKVLWRKSYESEFSSVAFSGATRTVRAREGCVRENLASLLKGIREDWNKPRLRL